MILILDIGKTNKKCFVFDGDYRIVLEQTVQIPEISDEDGVPCEDLDALANWVKTSVLEILADSRFQIRAVNVTTYGASFVHLDTAGNPLTPLYNYLKPFPEALQQQFFDTYGDAATIALQTASPVLGNLNSGMQLYWLKHQQPLIFQRIQWSLHLPQYISSLVAHLVIFKTEPYAPFSEMTSIGCHTMLWDFRKSDYHDWVKKEGLTDKFPPIQASGSVSDLCNASNQQTIHLGTGLHDSSAALIPYLACFVEPFLLISTGTWCISLNPFNQTPLTAEELAMDCLCYLTYAGNPVKAARYFGGNKHEIWTEKLAQAFDKPLDYYKQITFDKAIVERFNTERNTWKAGAHPFEHYETAYHVLILKIIRSQYNSTKLVLTPSTTRIFVDGGFSKNDLFMTLLANAFPTREVYAAEVAQATALGAAMAMHTSWNSAPLPYNLITLKKYEPFSLPSAVNCKI